MVNDSIVGLTDGTVRLVSHKDDWAELFSAEKARLLTVLAPYVGTVVRDIEHVGSTSIPGIPAKPIIDIAVVVSDFDLADPCIEAIRGLGYVYLGLNEVPGRHFFYLLDEGTTTDRTHHLHMFEERSREWRQTLGFRDYLRDHPKTAAAYGQIKLDLAQQFSDDRPGYLEGKAPFITQVLRLSVPEQPILWTTVYDLDTGLHFDYSQDVVDQPVTVQQGLVGGSRRTHLMTADRRSLYFEVTVFDTGQDVAESVSRLVRELHERFEDVDVSELQNIVIAGRSANLLAFDWSDMHREAIYVRNADNLFRFIYDPRGPLNLAIIDTVAWA